VLGCDEWLRGDEVKNDRFLELMIETRELKDKQHRTATADASDSSRAATGDAPFEAPAPPRSVRMTLHRERRRLARGDSGLSAPLTRNQVLPQYVSAFEPDCLHFFHYTF
jgi:hypothetical protein